jgi:hypothetical protein
MAEPSQQQVVDLVASAQARFPDLSQAELKLLRAAPKGEVAWCGPSPNDDDPANDPAKADEWGREREIRADLIRWLCVDSDAASAIDPRGIQIHAGRIAGALDLSYVSVPFPLRLRRCRLTDNVNLISTVIPALNLAGSRVQSIAADGANVKGGAFLRHGFSARGEVRLLGARIGGNLDCSAATFENAAKHGLVADGVSVRGDVFLNDGFSAEGEVRLPGARISGDLSCRGGLFKNPGKSALNADRADVKGNVFLSDRFTAEGGVRIVGAQIGGALDCHGGTFKNPDKDALSMDGADVKGAVFLNHGLSAEGEVRLVHVRVGGSLECDSGAFKNPGRDALSADGANVEGDVFLRGGFSAEGEVRLPGVQIGGDLDCTGGAFKNPGRGALSLHNAKVDGATCLCLGLCAEGSVGLPGARFGGDLEFNGGRFSEVVAENAAIRGTLFWRDVQAAERTTLNLTDASAGSLADDEKSWPAKGKLLPYGFVYGHISGDSPRDAKTRLRWLERQDPFTPQPYRQLAKVLREAGDDSGARKVLFDMERRRRRAEDRRWYARGWDWVLRWTIGYGFYPWRALGWLVLLTALGWGLFRHGYFSGAMAPTEKEAYHFFGDHGRAPDYYQRFTASIYSLENSLPFVNLGQKDHWTPDPNPQGSRWMPGFLRWFRWGQVLLGWVLATFFVAGVTGVVRKE